MNEITALTAQSNKEIQELVFSMGIAHSLISRDYLSQMTKGEILPLSSAEKNKPPQMKLRLFRVNSIVYDKFESINEKLNSLFCALSLVQNCNLVMILNNYIDDGTETQEFYIGVSGNSTEQTLEAANVLEQSLNGNFPGCEIKKCFGEDIENLMPNLIFKDKETPCAVSSISVDAGRRSTDENFVQGMEKFADGMRGKPYTLMVIASPVSGYELQNKINAYRDLYTQISPYKITTQTLNETHGGGYSITFGTQISKTLSNAKTVTDSRSTTKTSGRGQNVSQSQKNFAGSFTEIGASLLGMTGGIMLGSPALSLLGFAYAGRLVGSQINDFTNNTPTQETKTFQTSQSDNSGISTAEQKAESQQEGQNKSFSINENHSKGISLQRNVENKPVIDMLNSLDRQIKLMSAAKGQGAYNVAAYVLAADKIISETGAGLYCSLLSGGQPDSISVINTWDENFSVELIQDYLLRGLNPAVKLIENSMLNNVDLTTFVPCNQMPLHFFFPRKSLPGLSIIQSAEFARSMPCAVDKNLPQINLGKVFHFGREEKNFISLQRDMLCNHTCIVGAPGSGKSNMAYHLLSQLIKADLNFMVIEPAKGEYSQVLGGYPAVDLLSTQQINTPQFFSINPFAFPKGVNAINHVDALISLLTNCWTMYAAMTEILKDAVLQIYENAGWDMSDTGLPWEEENYYFPDFNDLLKVLPEIIEKSDYSNEVKGNYKGSLLTRIKSVTNGANKMIFGSDCRNDEILFNSKIIVDISSIKSSETRALLMGILIIRLDEFRQNENKGFNRPLHHITLLEEAHNILSAGGAPSSNNIAAKSVEILSHAIAEMRSYGEGFIIVDQTPSKIDSAIISNTATKIIFNLPNAEDSLPMRKAMTLNADQTAELAILPRGVCVVRSRGWNAPVQIKVPKFDAPKPYLPPPSKIDLKDIRVIRGKMLAAILNDDKIQAENLAGELRNEYKDMLILKTLNNFRTQKKFSPDEFLNLYQEFFDTVRWLRPPTRDNLEDWDKNARKQLQRRARLAFDTQNKIIQTLLISILEPKTKNLLDAWINLISNPSFGNSPGQG